MSQWTWDSIWPAPAKLNLFLHVVGRRTDGYHLLQTVFRFIDRSDLLRFSPRADGQIILDTPIPGVPAGSDLTVRAARLLQEATGYQHGVNIALTKKLPMGGGLGGGSSDAATVLLALNHLWETGLSRGELEKLGLTLGADVPVFIHGRNAFAEGIGETFSAVELPAATYLVLTPAVNVATSTIFGASGLKRDSSRISPTEWSCCQGHNDLEPVACRLFPVVAEHLRWLKAHAPHAMMTGSGACLFAGFEQREAAEAVCRQLPRGMTGWLAEGLSQHPLINL